MPRIDDPDDRTPTIEELRRVLSWGEAEDKRLILLLTTSEMRLSKTIKFKVKGVDFGSRPVRIRLSAKAASKAREEPFTYITDEAAGFIKQCLGRRIEEPNAWIFASEADSNRHTSEDLQPPT